MSSDSRAESPFRLSVSNSVSNLSNMPSSAYLCQSGATSPCSWAGSGGQHSSMATMVKSLHNGGMVITSVTGHYINSLPSVQAWRGYSLQQSGKTRPKARNPPPVESFGNRSPLPALALCEVKSCRWCSNKLIRQSTFPCVPLFRDVHEKMSKPHGYVDKDEE